MEIIFFIFPLLALAVGVASFVFWIWMLIDCIQKEEQDKLVWVLVILFLNSIGALIYFFIRYGKNGVPSLYSNTYR